MSSSAPTLTFPSVKLTITPVSGALTLDLTILITNLNWTESNDGINTLSVTLVVPETDLLTADDTDIADFYEMAFLPGGAFSLEFFEHPADSPSTEAVGGARTGDIVAVKHGLTASGRRTVSLTGMEAVHRLKGVNISKVANVDNPIELQDLLDEVAGEISAQAETEGSTYMDSTPIILNESMLGLVKTIAENNHKVVVYDAENSKIILQDIGTNTDGDVTVTWGFDLQSINLNLDLTSQATSVIVTGLKDENGEETPFTAETLTVERQAGGLSGVDLRSEAFGEYVISETPWGMDIPVGFTEDTTMAETRAAAVFQNMSDRFLTGSMTCVGKPGAKQNCKVTVENAPWPFAGEFIISSVNHSYSPDDGLTTEIGFFSNMVASPS